ncbi:MAG: hypothetical protein PVJ53_04505 [Desulfobacterales bacterium]
MKQGFKAVSGLKNFSKKGISIPFQITALNGKVAPCTGIGVFGLPVCKRRPSCNLEFRLAEAMLVKVGASLGFEKSFRSTTTPPVSQKHFKIH